jgi:hypothetical protein
MATIATVVAGVLAACGAPISANHQWQSLTTASSYQTAVPSPLGHGTMVLQHDVLSGPLSDAQGKPLAGTSFREDCSHGIYQEEFCKLLLNSGPRLYVAAGATLYKYPYYTFTSADRVFSPGSLTVDLIKQQGPKDFLIRITANKVKFPPCIGTKVVGQKDNGDGTITYSLALPSGPAGTQTLPDSHWDPDTATDALIAKLGLPPRPRGSSPQKTIGTDRATWVRAFTGLQNQVPGFCVLPGLSSGGGSRPAAG